MRMHASSWFFSLCIALLSSQASSESTAQEDALTAEANALVMQFGGQLKPKLKAAIQSGGLEHAIDVCAVEAPGIAGDLSRQSGWEIKRVSLQARNKSSATPDAFETAVLQAFEARQRDGEAPSDMEVARIVDGKFRYMRAQGVEALCLNCHGTVISEGVKKALEQHYPADEAIGYSVGQVRGAFSLRKAL